MNNIHIKQNPSITHSNSSTVQQLYAKFQNLKQRIINTDSKRSSRSKDTKCVANNNNKQSKCKKIGMVEPLPISVYVGMRNQSKLFPKQTHHVSYPNFTLNWEQDCKVIMQKVFTMISTIQQRYTDLLIKQTRKLSSLQSKLQIAQELINERRIQQDQLKKINQSYIENANNTTYCHTFKSFSQNTIDCAALTRERKNIKSKCSKDNKIDNKIDNRKDRLDKKKIVQDYQCQLFKQILAKDTLAHNRHSIIKDIDHHKDHQNINQNNGLRKIIQQYKLALKQSKQQNNILKEENIKLTQKLTQLQESIISNKIQTEITLNNSLQLLKLRKQLSLKSQQLVHVKQQNQQLLIQLQQIKINYNDGDINAHNLTKQSKETGSSQTIHHHQCSHKDLHLNTSNNHQQIEQNDQQHNNTDMLQKSLYIQTVLTDRSQILDNITLNQQQKQQSVQIVQFQLSELQQIKHSQSMIINRLTICDTKNKALQLKRKEKQLMDQIHLLQQENKLLKQKKDKFQAEIFMAENDQDMMQQQLDRLKQQIKRLNALNHSIDQCAVKLLKGEELKQQKILALEINSKLRQEFYKKKQTKKRGFSLRR